MEISSCCYFMSYFNYGKLVISTAVLHKKLANTDFKKLKFYYISMFVLRVITRLVLMIES